MATKDKEKLIEEIEMEVCGFGSLRLALREFRKMTGADAVRRLMDLRTYLTSLSDDRLRQLFGVLKTRLDLNAFPKAI